jgi:GxxExxY protein
MTKIFTQILKWTLTVFPHSGKFKMSEGGFKPFHFHGSNKSASPDDQKEEEPTNVGSIFVLKQKIERMATLIFQALGPGSKEKVYQKALEQMLHDENLVCMSEKPVPFYFNGECVAVGYADIVVKNLLVLELKAISGSIQITHINQCRQYMRGLRIEHGLVINFPQHQALGKTCFFISPAAQKKRREQRGNL